MTEHARPNWAPGMGEDRPSETPIAEDDFRTLPSRNLDQIFIIGSPHRPGLTPFIIEIEYTLYTPDTPDNAKLELIATKFPPCMTDMPWFTLIVPLKDLETIREIGKKYNFELKQDMTPICIDEHGTHIFPLDSGPNVFSVEGMLQDEALVQTYRDYWNDVIEKHAMGIPWKV